MSNYDMDSLLGTYADWIAWLKEKEASLEAQLARMKGKSEEREAENGEPVAEVSSADVPTEVASTEPEPVTPAQEVPKAALVEAEAETLVTEATVLEDDIEEEDDWL